MNASTKNDSPAQSAFGASGPEMLEGMAALGGDALERTMRLAAEATVRAWRGAAAVQLEAAQAMREKLGSGGRENVAALAASSEAAIGGMETCLSKAIDFVRTATDAGVETAGRTMAARTVDEWVGVQIDSANRMMNLGLAHSAELARVVTDTSTRCTDPLKGRVESAMGAD